MSIQATPPLLSNISLPKGAAITVGTIPSFQVIISDPNLKKPIPAKSPHKK